MRESILKALNQGITEQRWQIVGYGGSWSRAIAPLQQYIERKVRKEVRAAVASEREACAKVCESEGARTDASWAGCAAAIRARSKT
jgi:hypothetical protein